MNITGGFKDRLMDTLHGAVKHFNETGDPNQAVVKAARDADFNPEQTTRLVEAFNTARTLFHYKSASDRTSSFALADAGAVLTDLFERQEPAAKAAEFRGYAEYDARERSYFDQDREEKAAEAVPAEPPSMDVLSQQAMRTLRGLRQTAKIAEDEARLAGNYASQALTKLGGLLGFGYVSERQDQYARLFAAHGDNEWVPVMAKVAEFVPAQYRANDVQMRKAASVAVVDDYDLHQHENLLKEAREWLGIESEFLAMSGILEKEADEFEREWLEVAGCEEKKGSDSLSDFIRPEVLKVAQTVATEKYTTRNFYGDPVSVESKKETGGPSKPGITDAVSDFMFDTGKKPVGDLLNTGVTRMMTEPMARENKQLSEKLKNVQRQIMLQDLMTNDPVLAEESPETVAEAYQAILQMAPEVASNKEVVRAVLRQTVHSVAVSPYDAEVWTKLEKNLQNLQGKGVSFGSKESK